MVILDTDYLTLLEWPNSSSAQKIRDRLDQSGSDDAAATIVSFEEHMQGRIAGIRKEKEIGKQIAKYRSLRVALQAFCAIKILDFDEVAAVEFQRLRKQYRRLGTMDLKIAAITFAHRATLWTGNMQHFGQIAGLNAVDITRE
jgi:tRNA(fMet)-specific endonuclease VapC